MVHLTLKILFDICLHTVKWFQVLQFNIYPAQSAGLQNTPTS